MSFPPRRDRVRWCGLLGLALTVASCRGSGAGDSGTGWLAGDGKPVDLALTFDPANGAAKVITPRGGYVSASGADGTLYRLEVPEGALLSDERISLIPVTAVKGLPLNGGSVAAVHLKPEGLRLLKPATLHIRAGGDVPVAEQVGFAYFGNGKDAHLYPLTRNRSRIELPIFHFSGYGFGRAGPNDPGRSALQHAADKEARLASRVAEAINKDRAKPEGERSAATEILVEYLAQYYQEVLRPLMKIAETDERMAECAIQRALSWERQMQLLGVVKDDDPVHPNPGWPELERLRTEASVSGQRIAENYKQKFGKHFLKQCREEHDVFAGSNYVVAALALARQAALLGTASDDLPNVGEVSKDPVFEEILKCLSFELEFRSVFETKTADGDAQQHYHVHAQVSITQMPITPEGFGLLASPARAPLKYVGFSFHALSANRLIRMSGVGTRESALTVFSLAFAKTREKKEQTSCAGQDEWQEGFVADTVRVTLSPGKPVELVRGTGPGFNTVVESNGWLNFWSLFRQPEKVTYDPSAFSEAEASDVYMLKLRRESPGTWRVDFESAKTGEGSEFEDSSLILRHTPK
jgi:hypothetical protein